ncbi:MAG: hypothetical protein AAFQ92_21850 [Bacteroidota bacterium]
MMMITQHLFTMILVLLPLYTLGQQHQASSSFSYGGSIYLEGRPLLTAAKASPNFDSSLA